LIIKETFKFKKPEEELKNLLDSFELMLQLSNKEEVIKKQQHEIRSLKSSKQKLNKNENKQNKNNKKTPIRYNYNLISKKPLAERSSNIPSQNNSIREEKPENL